MKQTALALLIFCVIMVTGCSLLGIPANDTTTLATMASAVLGYQDEAVAGAASGVDHDDYSEKGISSKAIYHTEELVKVLANGTVVTITKTVDDNETPTDITDDILTVYRQYDIWSGETKNETIVRPLKPHVDWPGWDQDGRILQTGTVEVYIDGFSVQEGTIAVTWQLDGTEVNLVRLEQEMSGINAAGTVVRTIKEWDENGLLTMTQLRIRLTAGGSIETQEFHFEEVEIDGTVYTKIVRDDGAYAIIINKIDPRLTEHYDTNGVLRMTVRVDRDPAGRSRTLTRTLYDEQGVQVGDPIEIEVRYRVVGDTVLVTRSVNGRDVTVSIRETSEGYEVERRGTSYAVVFDNNDVLFYDETGSLIGRVVIDEDGSWIVEYPDGSTETVVL